jgi:hypothetical protein
LSSPLAVIRSQYGNRDKREIRILTYHNRNGRREDWKGRKAFQTQYRNGRDANLASNFVIKISYKKEKKFKRLSYRK